MHGEHSEQSIIVNAYLSCGRARTHDLRVGSHAPYLIVDIQVEVFNVKDLLGTRTKVFFKHW